MRVIWFCKNKGSPILKLSSVRFCIAFGLIVIIKICAVIYFSAFPVDFFGGGNDSEYYDAYAQGVDSEIPNIWPVLLRHLNDLGMYSRTSVSYFLALLGVLVIPLLVARLAVVKAGAFQVRTFWFVAFVIAAYPTLFFYTFDIYRDVLMVFVFLLGLLAIKGFIDGVSVFNKIGLLFLVFCIGYFLYLLRPYLGFGFLLAFFGFNFFRFRTASLSLYLVCFLLFINLAFAFGFLDPILMYREIFDDMEGGSNIGIRFGSTEMFLPYFLKSFLYQIFGFYFPNYFSVVIFFLESVPFMIGLIYLVRNRRYANAFVSYLVIFSLIYSTVWLLGNDNLGTAVRLRMYSYISIFIASMIVFQRKSISVPGSDVPSIG